MLRLDDVFRRRHVGLRNPQSQVRRANMLCSVVELMAVGNPVLGQHVDDHVLVLVLGFAEQAWRLEVIRSRGCSAFEPEAVAAVAVAWEAAAHVERVAAAALESPELASDWRRAAHVE